MFVECKGDIPIYYRRHTNSPILLPHKLDHRGPFENID